VWVEIGIQEFWGLYTELLKGQEKRVWPQPGGLAVMIEGQVHVIQSFEKKGFRYYEL
jgi:hypothetical protein